MKKKLLAGGLVALLALGLPVKSKASTFSNIPLCDISNNCNFSVSGEYTDTFWRFTFSKIAGGSDSKKEGVEMKVIDVPYGTINPAEVDYPQNWSLAITNGSEPNTTTYDSTKKLAGQSIREGYPQTLGANFNGNQPIGIADAPLTIGTAMPGWKVMVKSRGPPYEYFYGEVPVPQILSAGAIVPEPVSSTLFLIGGAALGFRRLRRRVN